MKSGVSTGHVGTTASWALTSGTPDADYPVANVADLSEPRRICKASGSVVITATLTGRSRVRFIGLLHHNAAGASMVVKLYDDIGLFHTSPSITLNDGDGLYPACTPYLLDAAVAATKVRLELSSGSWEIGAIDIADAWVFEDVQVEREIGFDLRDDVTEDVDGVDFVTQNWSPRTVVATRLINVVEEETIALDFQNEHGGDTVFVWFWDYDDPTTWDRQVFPCRDVQMTPLQKIAHPAGTVRFGVEEAL